MIRRAFFNMLHWLGNGSDFESYYGGVHRSNCTGCPDCRCDEGGPNHEEARRDFRAMLSSGMWRSG